MQADQLIRTSTSKCHSHCIQCSCEVQEVDVQEGDLHRFSNLVGWSIYPNGAGACLWCRLRSGWGCLVQPTLYAFKNAYQGNPEVPSGEAREVKDCPGVVNAGDGHHMLEILQPCLAPCMESGDCSVPTDSNMEACCYLSDMGGHLMPAGVPLLKTAACKWQQAERPPHALWRTCARQRGCTVQAQTLSKDTAAHIQCGEPA